MAHNFHNDDDGNPNVSSGNIPAVERNSSIYWNFINLVFSARWIKSETLVNRCWHVHQQLSSSSYKKRIEIISDDMTSIARSCCVEMATGSALHLSPERRVVDLRPPKRSAPKRRRKTSEEEKA